MTQEQPRYASNGLGCATTAVITPTYSLVLRVLCGATTMGVREVWSRCCYVCIAMAIALIF